MAAEGIRRPAGGGWLVLIGGGEFSFGETEAVDAAWLERTGEGVVGFVPAASGSSDYGRHFAQYLQERFQRRAETVPIYRARDGRRGKNLRRLEAAAAVYLGAGVAEQLLDAVVDTPAVETLLERLRSGGTVAAIGAAAQTLGRSVRSVRGDAVLDGLGWLVDGVVETNFSPAHDRRLRQLMESPGVGWGLGIPSGSAVLLGPEGRIESVGLSFLLDDAEGELKVLGGPLEAAPGVED